MRTKSKASTTRKGGRVALKMPEIEFNMMQSRKSKSGRREFIGDG